MKSLKPSQPRVFANKKSGAFSEPVSQISERPFLGSLNCCGPLAVPVTALHVTISRASNPRSALHRASLPGATRWRRAGNTGVPGRHRPPCSAETCARRGRGASSGRGLQNCIAKSVLLIHQAPPATWRQPSHESDYTLI